MSCILYAIIENKNNILKSIIAEKCFEYVSFACSKKVAIDRIDVPSGKAEYLKNYEIGMDISNNYLECMAEPFIEPDFELTDPFAGNKLKDLEEVIEFILNSPTTACVRLYMMTEEPAINEKFEKIKCSIKDFAESFKDKIYFDKTSFSYEFIFENII